MRVTTDEGGGASGLEPSWLLARPEVKARPKDVSRGRLWLFVGLFVLLFGTICGRLISYGFDVEAPTVYQSSAEAAISAARPDIVDRNGEILATDIRSYSLYAEPRLIQNPEEVAEGIHSVLADLSVDWLVQRLTGTGGFVWLERELTPPQQEAVHNLGFPGLGFLTENQRFYPGGPVAAYIVGSVNVDNQGIAGLEKYLDTQGLADLQAAGFANGDDADLQPVELSIDLRVQHIVRDELVSAVQRYSADAAVGIVLNIHTGEVVAMSSVPDYDPNDPVQALDPTRLNRATAGVYELGSVFKTFTLAEALDNGAVTLNTVVDASHPLTMGGFTIHDLHAQNRPLTVPEVFTYSSNIGAARIALMSGPEAQQEFLRRLGITARPGTELPERALPLVPSTARWNDLVTATIAFGHGLGTTPMNVAVGAAALMNDGMMIPPTLFPRDEATANQLATRVVSSLTSQEMRYLFRANVLDGSGSNAGVIGYLVGGKTGTAEKVVDGRYSGTLVLNSFLAAFPMNDPQYIVMVVVDNPHPEGPGLGTTAGLNAAPTVSNIIRRSASLLGVAPNFTSWTGAALSDFQ